MFMFLHCSIKLTMIRYDTKNCLHRFYLISFIMFVMYTAITWNLRLHDNFNEITNMRRYRRRNGSEPRDGRVFESGIRSVEKTSSVMRIISSL